MKKHRGYFEIIVCLLVIIELFFYKCEVYAQPATQTQALRKLALVIGNGNYVSSSILANPENDARAIAAALQSVGFTVLKYENLNQRQMKQAIDEFGLNLKSNDVGLFFYAGHGIQSKGYNYLIPIDAQIQSEPQVEYDCVQADRVLAIMEGSGSKVNIVILDACRNNPFERSWTRSESGKGLAFMNAPKGTLIAYATSPGSTAADGSGNNGLYTSAILESIKIPNITILQMFQQVRGIVTKKSNEKQTPWESTSLTGDFYFNPDTSRNFVNQVQITEPIAKLPAIAGLEISNISPTGASAMVSLINDNGAEITVRGVCWNNTGNPTVSNNKTTEGIGNRGFSSTLLSLTPGKTYFVRAYATNSVGTEYSNQITFNTPSIRPDIVTEKVNTSSSSSAISMAAISSDGGATILARGVCWNTSPNPTIENEKTSDGSGIGKYSSTVNGLSPNTTYYLKAYSTNYLETSYGNEVVFKTLGSGQIKDIDDNVYNTIVIGNQTWLQENLKTKKYNDGSPIELVVDKTRWKRLSPSYCWFENQAEYGKTCGALYNLSAVMTDKLCPTGWHIPIKAEWDILINNIGGAASAWSVLTEENMAIVTTSDKKTTVFPGFKAVPGGYRDENGEYQGIGDYGSWWHYSRNISMDITSHYLDFKNRQIIYRKNSAKNKMLGLSVRCVKD